MVWVGKSEGRRPLERHRRRWESNVKRYRKETLWEVTGQIDFAQKVKNEWLL